MSGSFSKKQLQEIFDEVFNHFKRKRIFYFEYKEYLESKGYDEDEIRRIWAEAYRKNIIDTGVFPLHGKAEISITRPSKERKRPDLII
mgnify:CR=1 FL=1